MSAAPQLDLNWPAPTEFPRFGPEELHVWAVPLDRSSFTDAEIAATLSAEEQSRVADFAFDRPRNFFVATRIALRLLAGRYLGESPEKLLIVIDRSGKPRLAEHALSFNVAHSGNLALIAFAHGREVGVDVELLRPVDGCFEIATKYFHPNELAAIRGANGAERSRVFLRCWTRKEAVIKALGVGLRYPLDSIDTLTRNELLVANGDASIACHLQDLPPAVDYLAAICTLGARPPWLGFTYSLQ